MLSKKDLLDVEDKNCILNTCNYETPTIHFAEAKERTSGLWSMVCFLPEQAWLAGLLWTLSFAKDVLRFFEELEYLWWAISEFPFDTGFHWLKSEMGLLPMVYSNGQAVSAIYNFRRPWPPFVNVDGSNVAWEMSVILQTKPQIRQTSGREWPPGCGHQRKSRHCKWSNVWH